MLRLSSGAFEGSVFYGVVCPALDTCHNLSLPAPSPRFSGWLGLLSSAAAQTPSLGPPPGLCLCFSFSFPLDHALISRLHIVCEVSRAGAGAGPFSELISRRHCRSRGSSLAAASLPLLPVHKESFRARACLIVISIRAVVETYHSTGRVPGFSHWSSHVIPFLFVAKSLGQGEAVSLPGQKSLVNGWYGSEEGFEPRADSQVHE